MATVVQSYSTSGSVTKSANPTVPQAQALALTDGEGNIAGVANGNLQTQTKGFRDGTATAQGSGAVTAPTAGAVIATVTPGAAGLWEVQIWWSLSGTLVAGDANNLQLRQTAAVRLTPLPIPATANLFPPPVTVVLSLSAVDTVSVNAIAAGSASAVYNAVIVARQVG